jgi:sugar lactone lactonase YvrE
MQRLAVAALLLCAACLYQYPETTPAPAAPSEQSGPDLVPPALAVIGKLAGPESVLYDPEHDVYFISNLNGGLLAQDNNGFISRVNAKTMQVELQWIAGGTNGVRLDAPKGMAVAGDTLYVSDVTAVRTFDRRTGAPKGEIPLPGATLINDLTTDGRDVYASDTAVVPSAGITFAPTGTDAIWKISGGRASKIASGTELNQPNGIDFHKGRLWVATFRGGELYRLEGSKKAGVIKVPRPQLDGLVHLADGTPVVSSWTGKAVYRGNVAILRGLAAPADLGYDTKRRLLLVPNSTQNQVTVHPVS